LLDVDQCPCSTLYLGIGQGLERRDPNNNHVGLA